MVLIYGTATILLLPIVWMTGTSFKPSIEYVSTSVDLLPD